MKYKDEDKLTPLLRSFKNGDVDIDYTIDYILRIFKDSKRFNSNSFLAGMLIGLTLATICLVSIIN